MLELLSVVPLPLEEPVEGPAEPVPVVPVEPVEPATIERVAILEAPRVLVRVESSLLS